MMSGDPSRPSLRLAIALVGQTTRARQPGQPAAAVRTASRLRRAECRIRAPGDIAPAVAAQVIDVRRIRLGRQATQQPGNQALEGSGHRAILDPSIHAYASPGRFMPTCGRPRSEEHTSELQSIMSLSYAVFCLKKKKKLRHQSTH